MSTNQATSASPVRSMEIIISLLVGDSALRQKIKAILDSQIVIEALHTQCDRHSNIVHTYEINTENKPEEAQDLLDQLFQAPGRSVIVISDLMVEETHQNFGDTASTTKWWSTLHDQSPSDRLGSIAISPLAPTRISDVDRVIPPDIDLKAFCDAIAIVVHSLEYKQPPCRRNLFESIIVRHLRTTEELHSYYSLRHRIYSIMGYLHHNVEGVPTGLEFDWCDLNSIPIGAFCDGPDGHRLVGTARLITTHLERQAFSAETERLAREDRTGVLSDRLHKAYTFQMPFLQTHPDSEIVCELNRDYYHTFCELSRVIVEESYRGLGISKALIEYSLTVATHIGMQRIFLECLPSHRPLYEAYAFQVVPGRRQRVYNVNKTMDLMELKIPSVPGLSQCNVTRRHEGFRDHGFLCRCYNEGCPTSVPKYSQFRKVGCPLINTPSPVSADDRHLFRETCDQEASS